MPWSSYSRPTGDLAAGVPYATQLGLSYPYFAGNFPLSGSYITLNDIATEPQFKDLIERTSDGRLIPKGSRPFPLLPAYRKPIRQVG